MLGNLKLWLNSQELCSVSVLNFLQGVCSILAFASPNNPPINFRLKKTTQTPYKGIVPRESQSKVFSFSNDFIDGKTLSKIYSLVLVPQKLHLSKIGIISQKKKILVELVNS